MTVTSLSCSGGWKEGHSYRFNLLHRPKIGLIRLKLWEGEQVSIITFHFRLSSFPFRPREQMIADSGNLVDDGVDNLRGGRLGVYCDSQEGIIWSALSYSCSNTLPTDLDSSIQELVTNKK